MSNSPKVLIKGFTSDVISLSVSSFSGVSTIGFWRRPTKAGRSSLMSSTDSSSVLSSVTSVQTGIFKEVLRLFNFERYFVTKVLSAVLGALVK